MIQVPVMNVHSFSSNFTFAVTGEAGGKVQSVTYHLIVPPGTEIYVSLQVTELLKQLVMDQGMPNRHVYSPLIFYSCFFFRF